MKPYSNIFDKSMRNSIDNVIDGIEELEDENQRLKNTIKALEATVEEKDIEIAQLTDNITELSNYTKDLEDQIAEIYLTSYEETK